jgi:hypothetical protein
MVPALFLGRQHGVPKALSVPKERPNVPEWCASSLSPIITRLFPDNMVVISESILANIYTER